MSTISHEPSGSVQERKGLPVHLTVPEMWASLAIVVMWLAVLFDAIFGPDIVSSTNAGTTTSTTVPSAVALALFASLATWAVARYGFGRRRRDTG